MTDTVSVETMQAEPLIVALASASHCDASLVGSKAAVLSRLVHDGFAVPEGIVLTTAAFRSAASALSDGRLPLEVEHALEEIVAELPDATLAVRSSSVAEDRADASFAGQYESVLGVRGLPSLRQAVLRCWAGAFDARIGAYGGQASAPLAVLVQRQVNADAAGVAFTADPVTGARDVVLVSAVPGLGDQVAQGAVQPDEWLIGEQGARAESAELGALTAQQAAGVAALARRIEERCGAAQDVEWASVDGTLFVLQARPITALPVAPAESLPAGIAWTKERERYAEPFSALGASFASEVVARGLTEAFTTCGALIDRAEARVIGGELYLSMHTPGRPGAAPPPWWVFGLLARTQPVLRSRARRARRMLSDGDLDAALRRWREETGPECDRRAAELRRVALGGLTETELARHIQAVADAARMAMAHHFELTVPITVLVYRLVSFCESELGWSTARSLQLLAGSSPASAEPSRALRRLAANANAVERRAVLALPQGRVLEGFADAAPRLAPQFEAWCERYAFLGMSDDPGAPVFWERPALLERLIADAFAGERAMQDSAVSAEATGSSMEDAALRALKPADRERFLAVLRGARSAHGVRDDVAQRTGAVFGGLLRLAALEAGRRLVASGALGRREDAVQLDLDTLCRALIGGVSAAADATGEGQLRARVARAAGERAWTRAHPGPDAVGPVVRMPDMRGLPAAARELNRALLWARGGAADSEVGTIGADDRNLVLTGVPASPGRYSGPVRVLTDGASAGDLRAGEVLVCATADPALSVVFGIAGALVTDRGGALSHAAIVARENAIPAVLGTGSATTVLRTGMNVVVDGSTGRIEVCDPVWKG